MVGDGTQGARDESETEVSEEDQDELRDICTQLGVSTFDHKEEAYKALECLVSLSATKVAATERLFKGSLR